METIRTLTPNSIRSGFTNAKPYLHSVLIVKPHIVPVTESIPIQIDTVPIIDIPLGLNLPVFSWQIVAPTMRIGAVFDEGEGAYALVNPRFFLSSLLFSIQTKLTFNDRLEVISSGV